MGGQWRGGAPKSGSTFAMCLMTLNYEWIECTAGGLARETQMA